jgi:hypothetical protein
VEYIATYDLDFIGLAIILLLEIIFYLLKIVSLIKYGKEGFDQKINNEEADNS